MFNLLLRHSLAAAGILCLAVNQLPAQEALANLSPVPWKLVVKTPLRGTLIVDDGGTTKVTLAKAGDAVTVPAGANWGIQYQDAPGGLLTAYADQAFEMVFNLVGTDGKAVELKAYRKGYPNSHVWVGNSVAFKYDNPDFRQKFHLNDTSGGSIHIIGSGEPMAFGSKGQRH